MKSINYFNLVQNLLKNIHDFKLMMFHFQNLKQKFCRFSYFGNYVNSFQILNLTKHDIYPNLKKKIIKNVPSNFIINSEN